MGYPGETLHDLKTSIAFILWQQELYTQGLKSDSPEYETAMASVNSKMFTATAYPGTAMFKDGAVKESLSTNFAIRFDSEGEPVTDPAFREYILELDDATKILHNEKGEPLNFSAIPTETYLQAREYIDNCDLEKVLDM